MKTLESHVQDAVAKACGDAPQEEQEKCVEMLNQIVKEGKSPKDVLGYTPEILNNMYGQAYNLYITGNYRKSSLIFNLLSLLDDTNPAYFFGLASCYHMEKKYKEAIDAYAVSYLLDVTDPLPSFHMADCYLKMNNNPLAYLNLSLTVFLAGDKPEYATLKQRADLMRETVLGDGFDDESKGD